MFIWSPVSFDLAETILPDIDVFNKPGEMILLFAVLYLYVPPCFVCFCCLQNLLNYSLMFQSKSEKSPLISPLIQAQNLALSQALLSLLLSFPFHPSSSHVEATPAI